MSKQRPVTLPASGDASQVVMTAIQRGLIFSWRPSGAASPPMRSAVMRDQAVGARQLTVTPYLASSWAAMIENEAMPALAAP